MISGFYMVSYTRKDACNGSACTFGVNTLTCRRCLRLGVFKHSLLRIISAIFLLVATAVCWCEGWLVIITVE
ncbi:unnamed protein product [Trifolium pratense]|uniref:Uncharacterized protein n=1 Tax=Trifolium pratense TaxID=57577 RepID=A0ACB0KXQ8_TRIPR|nr:unnamed protein product [Trifolium pratense]